MRRLEDRVAIVTGGERGLGLALTRRLAEEGAAVVIADVAACDRHLRDLPATIAEQITFRSTDVTSGPRVQETIEEIVRKYGRIDILINNAAIFTSLERKPLDQLTTKDWEDALAVNVIGAFHCIKAVIPSMKAQGTGKIINIASNVVSKGLPMLLHYVASKGALVAMTRAAARELGSYNITVNAVAPGYMRHPDFSGWDAGRDERVVGLRSLPRTQTPDDVVGSVAFLASKDSDFITGQTIVVDGGETFH